MTSTQCPKCGLLNPSTATACDCGYLFSPDDPRFISANEFIRSGGGLIDDTTKKFLKISKLIGMILFFPSSLLVIQYLYEAIYLTAKEGSQAIFFALAHGHGFPWLGPFSFLGYLSFLTTPFFILWFLIYASYVLWLWRRKIELPKRNWQILWISALSLGLLFSPYDFWKLLIRLSRKLF